MESQHQLTVTGRLLGVLCGRRQIFDPLVGTRIYALPSRSETSARPAPREAQGEEGLKTVLRRSNADELAKLRQGAGFVLEGTVSEDGSFRLDGAGYPGGEVEIYAVISSVPSPKGRTPSAPLDPAWILFLGRHDPRPGPLDLFLPPSIWCRLKRIADIWTIVGRVSRCDNPSVPLVGVTVRAFDVDWTQQDSLGSAVTGADGSFRIDYPGAAFRQGTFIDVELFGGPDVYFKIEASGLEILAEPPARGREPGRADSGPCLCVDLCVDLPSGGETGVPTAWTGVGSAFTIPAGPSLHDFDADGYAGGPKYGLSSVIAMTGSAPLRTAAGNPVEYRFLVSSTTAPNGGPAVPAGAFTRVVGKDADASLFASIKVGEMVRFVPFFEIVEIDATSADLDANGWLDVNRSIQRTFATHATLTPADIPTFQFVDRDGLLGINTNFLTTAPDVPAGAATAGQAIPAANLVTVERFAVRFEIRDGVTHLPLSGDGTTLNSMVANNTTTFAKVEVTEHQTVGSCTPLSGTIHMAYTVYHPLLQAMSLRVRSNDGSYDQSLADPPSLPLSGNTNPAVTGQNDPALTVPPPLHRCTYLVTLSASPRLHNGEVPLGHAQPQTTFFYEGP